MAVKWEGIVPAAMTMFDKNGVVDKEASVAHWNWLIEEGVQGIVITGTSGEFIALSDKERREVIELGLEAVNGRVPVMVGTGYYSTKLTIEITHFAEKAGADAALVILPYYQRPSKEGVMNHYRNIASSTSLPIFCYNNPVYSGAPELTPWDLAKLYDEGVLAGVKSTFPTVHQVHNCRILTDEGFRVFYGSFRAALEGFAAGAHGWTSGFLNIVPSEAVAMWKAIKEKSDLKLARDLWYRLVPLVNLYTEEPLGHMDDLPLYRSVLDLRGMRGGFSRKPFEPISQSQKEQLVPYLKEAGLL
jgi:4-hydroxy-tetrahydrodipicolinate synthase